MCYKSAMGVTVYFSQPYKRRVPFHHLHPLSEVTSGDCAGQLPYLSTVAGLLGAEEAGHLCYLWHKEGRWQGTAGQSVSLECYIPAPPGANRSEPCLFPGENKKRRLVRERHTHLPKSLEKFKLWEWPGIPWDLRIPSLPSFPHPLGAPARNHRTLPAQPWSPKTSGS